MAKLVSHYDSPHYSTFYRSSNPDDVEPTDIPLSSAEGFPIFSNYKVVVTQRVVYIIGMDVNSENCLLLTIARNLQDHRLKITYDNFGLVFPALADVDAYILELCTSMKNPIQQTYQNVFGILGVIQLQRYYLHIITRRTCVGNILGKTIFRIDDTAYIELNALDDCTYVWTNEGKSMRLKIDPKVELQYFDFLKQTTLAKDCFFSHQYDLSTNLQTQSTQSTLQQPHITFTRSSTAAPLPPPPDLQAGSNSLPDTPIPFISESTTRQPSQYNELFTWNAHLLRTFVQAFPHTLEPFDHFPLRAPIKLAQSSFQNVISLTGPYSPYRWYTPVIQGYVSQTTFLLNSICYHFTLLCRRSVAYAGTRYNRRGINSAIDSTYHGGVANEVETEMILQAILPPHLPPNPTPTVYQPSLPHSQTFVSSATLYRGSIPLLWKQTGDMQLTPDIHVSPLQTSYPSTTAHFKGMLSKYHGRIHIVSLIKQKESKKKREMLLGEAYGYAVQHVNSQLCNDSYMYKLKCKMDQKSGPKNDNDDGTIRETPVQPSYLTSYVQPWYHSLSPLNGMSKFSHLAQLRINTCPCHFANASTSSYSQRSDNKHSAVGTQSASQPDADPLPLTLTTTDQLSQSWEDNCVYLLHQDSVHHIGVPSNEASQSLDLTTTTPGVWSPTVQPTSPIHFTPTQSNQQHQPANQPNTPTNTFQISTALHNTQTHPKLTSNSNDSSAQPQPQPHAVQHQFGTTTNPIQSYMGKAIAYHTYDFLGRNKSGYNPLDELIPLATKILDETSIFGGVFSNSPIIYPYHDYSSQQSNHDDVFLRVSSSIPPPPPSHDVDLMDLLCGGPQTPEEGTQNNNSTNDNALDRLKQIDTAPSIARAVRSLYNSQHVIVTSVQSGIARINCVDSCDRTNACCYIFGTIILKKQLNHLTQLIALATKKDESFSAPTNLTPQFDTLPTPLTQILQHSFTEHGDHIAHQYTGTNAMHRELLFVKDSSTRKVGNNPLYYPRLAYDNDKTLPIDFRAPYADLQPNSQQTTTMSLRSPTVIGHLIPSDKYQYPPTLLQFSASKDKCENIAALLSSNHQNNTANAIHYIIVLNSSSTSYTKWLEASPKEYIAQIHQIQQQHQEYNKNARRQQPIVVHGHSSQISREQPPTSSTPLNQPQDSAALLPTTTAQLTLDTSPQSPTDPTNPQSTNQPAKPTDKNQREKEKDKGFFSSFKWGSGGKSAKSSQTTTTTTTTHTLVSTSYIEDIDDSEDDYSTPSTPTKSKSKLNLDHDAPSASLSPFEKMSGLMSNGFTAAKRYYINNYTDTETQRQINLYLGFFIPFYSKQYQHFYRHLWDLPVDVVYSDTDSKFFKVPQNPLPPTLFIPFTSARLYLVPNFSKNHLLNLKHFHTSFYSVPSVALHGCFNPSLITRLATHFKTKAFTQHVNNISTSAAPPQQILMEDEGEVVLLDVNNITQTGTTPSVVPSHDKKNETGIKPAQDVLIEFQQHVAIEDDDLTTTTYTNNPLSQSFQPHPMNSTDTVKPVETANTLHDDEFDQLLKF